MKLDGFVIAIRFNRCFSINDNLGAIIDKIINDSNDLFGNTVFCECYGSIDERVLSDKDGQNKLTINSENFVLELSGLEDFEATFNAYVVAFQKLIGGYIFDKYDIRKINRFGCVIKTELDKSDKVFENVEHIISQEKKAPDSLSLRFNCSENKPKEIKGIPTTDYENEILTYSRKIKDSSINFTIDYQYYFRPPLNRLVDTKLKFSSFCKTSFNNFKNDYLSK